MTTLLAALLLGAEPAWFGVMFDPEFRSCARVQHVARDGGALTENVLGDCLEKVGGVETAGVASAIAELQKQLPGRPVALTFSRAGVVMATPVRKSTKLIAALCDQADWAQPFVYVDGSTFRGTILVPLTHRGFTVREAVSYLAVDAGVPAIDLTEFYFELREPDSCVDPKRLPNRKVAKLDTVLAPRSWLSIVAKGATYSIVR